MTPLHEAARMGHAGAIEGLVKRGADVRLGDCHGKTPLHWAGQEGHLSAAEALARCGADVGEKDGRDGQTPLHLATKSGRVEVVWLLAGLDGAVGRCDVEDLLGRTPLAHACDGGFAECVTGLVRSGFSHLGRDYKGRSALYFASGDPELLRLIVTSCHVDLGHVESQIETGMRHTRVSQVLPVLCVSSCSYGIPHSILKAPSCLVPPTFQLRHRQTTMFSST